MNASRAAGEDPVTDPAIQRLIDIEAIKRLKARYFRTLDRKDWAAWGQVFSTDAVFEVPETGTNTTGRDAIVAFVSAALKDAKTVHHGQMPEIDLTGPDTASGTWAMFDLVEFPPAADGTRIGQQGFGHYEEVYVRENEEWCISHLRLVRLRVDALA